MSYCASIPDSIEVNGHFGGQVCTESKKETEKVAIQASCQAALLANALYPSDKLEGPQIPGTSGPVVPTLKQCMNLQPPDHTAAWNWGLGVGTGVGAVALGIGIGLLASGPAGWLTILLLILGSSVAFSGISGLIINNVKQHFSSATPGFIVILALLFAKNDQTQANPSAPASA